MMRSTRLWGTFFLLAAFALSAVNAGCGGDKKDGDKKGTGGASGDSKGSEAAKGDAAKGELKAVDVKPAAVVKGKVRYKGAAKANENETFPKEKDGDHCAKGKDHELLKANLITGADGGLANAVVFLQAPEGHYFKLPEALTKPATAEVVIDQPHCAFVPHAVVLFPSHFDGKKQQPTGQKFTVKNSAPIAHNTTWEPENKRAGNTGENKLVPAGSHIPVTLQAARSGNTGWDRVKLSCTIHPWMNGYAWVFDHPFAAVTDKDGNFEIKNAPAGAAVKLAVWHDSMGSNVQAEDITLKDGDNAKDLEVK